MEEAGKNSRDRGKKQSMLIKEKNYKLKVEGGKLFRRKNERLILKSSEESKQYFYQIQPLRFISSQKFSTKVLRVGLEKF